MSARRILLRVLVVSAFILICFFAIWRIFRVDDRLRFAILDKFRPLIGNTLQIEDLYVRPFSVNLKNTQLEASSEVSLNIQTIRIRVAPIVVLLKGIQSPGAVKEIEFIRPQFYLNYGNNTISNRMESSIDPTGKEWIYSPEFLDKLHDLSMIDKIRISRGQFITGQEKTLVCDKLRGYVERESNSSARLDVEGSIPQVPGMKLQITGNADLEENNFLLVCQLISSDLRECNISRIIPNTECLGGKVRIDAELSGSTDLILIGRLNAENLNLRYKLKNDEDSNQPDLVLNNGFFSGALFDNEFQFTGNFDLNGLSLPIEGGVEFQKPEDQSFTFRPKWYASIHNSFLDLSTFTFSRDILTEKDRQLSGIANLLINIRGDSSEVNGNLNFTSSQVVIDSISINNSSVGLLLENGAVIIDTLSSSIFGGAFWANGQIGSASSEDLISMQFYRKWRSEELGKWSGMNDPYLSLKGFISKQEDSWFGDGSGSLFSSTGINLLKGKLNWENDILSVNVNPDNHSDFINLRIKLPFEDHRNEEEAATGDVWELKGKNPQKLLRKVLSAKLIPNQMEEYELEFGIKGANYFSKDYSDLCEGFIKWQSLDKNRSGTISGRVQSDTTGTLMLNSELALKVLEYPEGRIRTTSLTGPFQVSYIDQILSINELELSENRHLFGTKQKVLYCSGKINLSDKVPDSLEIVFDEFPLVGFLKYYKEDIPDQITGTVGAMILANPDSISFGGFSNLSGIREKDYSIAITGNWSNGSLYLQKGGIVQPDGKQVMAVTGGIDFKDHSIDSLLITADDMELEAILQAFAFENKILWGGSIDARIELDGDIPFPKATIDAHLSSGLLHNQDGYWGNLRMLTEGERYNLVGFDFGRGPSGLVRANGEFNRNSREYEVELTGENVEIQSLIMALTGETGILSGTSHLAVLLKGEKLSEHDSLVSLHQVSGELSVEPGELGGLEFDQLSAHFRLLEQDWKYPNLEIDSISIDWGGSNARIFGTLPLSLSALNTNETKTDSDRIRQLDISGFANGNFIEWLPRLSDSFSDPRGNGRIDFKLGGSIDKPKLTATRIKLNGGGFKADEIIRKVSSLSLDIELDSSSRIHVNQFEGKIDGHWLRLSNRFPDENDTIETIKFSNYDLGVLGIQTDEEGVWAVIPRLMEDEWGGYISISGKSGEGPMEVFGPAAQPYACGKLGLRKTTFTYPFIEGGGEQPNNFGQMVINLLSRINWDVAIVPQWDCRYVNEISGLKDIPLFETLQNNLSSALFDFDVKLYLDILIDEENSFLNFNGAVEDTFSLNGEINANRGSVEYLDLNFEVQQVGFRINSAEFNPILSGTAVTSVNDSSGIPREIRLVIRNTGADINESNDPLNRASSGGWDEISLMFEDDQGHSQEQILAMMGYAPDQLSQKLFDLGGTLVEKAVPIKRWTRYIERNLEKFFGIDKVDIDPQVAHNLIEQQLFNRADSTLLGAEEYSYLMALNKSKVTIGKHLNRDTYISYTALLQHGVDSENVKRLGMMHYWDLLIRLRAIAPNLNLNYRYQFDGLTELDDHSFRINYGFYLDL